MTWSPRARQRLHSLGLLAALILTGCGARPEPPTAPDGPVDFERDGDPTISLLHDPAELALTEAAPDLEATPAAFTVHVQPTGQDRLTGPLPFPVSADDARFAPPGMEVFAGDRSLPWSMRPRGSEPAWTLHGDELLVHWPEPEPPDALTVRHPELQARLERLVPALSGLPPADFVRYEYKVGDLTRVGLLLPAPSTATWELTLPPAASLSTTALLVPPPVDGASDGATVHVELDSGDGWQPVDALTLRPGHERPWRVSLAEHAGEDVRLRVRTEPGAGADHDYVLLLAPVVEGTPSQVRRVVVIGVDTLRADHLGVNGYTRDTSPELDALAATSTVFSEAWSPAPRTRPSFRAVVTGRRPLDAVGAPTLGQVFSEHGFATAGIVANVHLNPRFGFHAGYDRWALDTRAKAHEQVDRGLAWLGDHAHRDAFLFLHLMDPHLFYAAPSRYRDRFVEDADPDLPAKFNRSQVLSWQRSGELTDQRRANIEALYDGEIAYTSAEIGRFLDGLDALPGPTLLVFLSDHGEEFWEHGGYEHNHTLYQEVVSPVLWFRVPGATPGRPEVATTLIDVAPTLYDLLGFTDVPPTDGVSLRPWIEGGTDDLDRPLPVAYLMYDHEQWGVVWRGHKYVLTTATGKEVLYDLRADPGEQHDRSAGQDLAPLREALAEAHGMEVGPGWRVHMELRGAPTVSLELPEATGDVAVSTGGVSLDLPAPARAAWVVDPEALRRRRTNQAWGETPPVVAADVARLTLSEDGRAVEIHPGTSAVGQVAVLFDAEVPPPTSVRVGPTVRPLPWREGPWRVEVEASTVVHPPPDEAARMHAITAASASDHDLLQVLGYIGE